MLTVLAKADPAAVVRGRRTTQLSDSDVNATRHARAAVGGTVACAVGKANHQTNENNTTIFINGGTCSRCARCTHTPSCTHTHTHTAVLSLSHTHTQLYGHNASVHARMLFFAFSRFSANNSPVQLGTSATARNAADVHPTRDARARRASDAALIHARAARAPDPGARGREGVRVRGRGAPGAGGGRARVRHLRRSESRGSRRRAPFALLT